MKNTSTIFRWRKMHNKPEVSKSQLGKIALGGLVGLLAIGIGSIIWQSQSIGQSNSSTSTSPWIGEEVGISRLSSNGDLVRHFTLDQNLGGSGVDCSQLRHWWPGTRYEKGEQVRRKKNAWEANKRTRAIPRFRTSGQPGSNKPWIHLGRCLPESSPSIQGIIGLLDDGNVLWAYRHDHQLFQVDTLTGSVSRISLPAIVQEGDVDCSRFNQWESGIRYKRRDRVHHLDHGWRAKRPLVESQI